MLNNGALQFWYKNYIYIFQNLPRINIRILLIKMNSKNPYSIFLDFINIFYNYKCIKSYVMINDEFIKSYLS